MGVQNHLAGSGMVWKDKPVSWLISDRLPNYSYSSMIYSISSINDLPESTLTLLSLSPSTFAFFSFSLSYCCTWESERVSSGCWAQFYGILLVDALGWGLFTSCSRADMQLGDGIGFFSNGLSFIAIISSLLFYFADNHPLRSQTWSLLLYLLVYRIGMFQDRFFCESLSLFSSRLSIYRIVFLIIPDFALSKMIFFSGLLISFILLNLDSRASLLLVGLYYLGLFLSNKLATFFLFPPWESRAEDMCETGCFQQLTFCQSALSANYFIFPIIFILLGFSLPIENFNLQGSIGTIPMRTQELSLASFDSRKMQLRKFNKVYFSDNDFSRMLDFYEISFI